MVSMLTMLRSSEDTIALLHRVPVFSTLSPAELERVALVAVPRRFEAGEVVFKEGDEGSTCYIVRAGRTRAIRAHPDGRSITLAHFGPGDIFGEMAMLDGERRSATVEATEDTEAIAILSAATVALSCCSSAAGRGGFATTCARTRAAK